DFKISMLLTSTPRAVSHSEFAVGKRKCSYWIERIFLQINTQLFHKSLEGSSTALSINHFQ
ncbi:hypothetical protein STEG23_034402, partial [Scotinomys teguina]